MFNTVTEANGSRPPIKYMYITNRPDVAKIAERNTVERIWVDLEKRGKAERQGTVNSVKSDHTMADVSLIRDAITKAELLVRINPLWENSRYEVDEAISRGADIMMLPMFRTADEAKRFIDMVKGRARVLLLVETIGAEQNIEEIASLPGVDEIHIGLNDLHLEYGMKFMFELLANGTVDALVEKIAARGIPYGFGGIARLNQGRLPARFVIAEHYRLGSSMAILSRSFYDTSINFSIDDIERVFRNGMTELRDYERRLATMTPGYFEQGHELVVSQIDWITKNLVVGAPQVNR